MGEKELREIRTKGAVMVIHDVMVIHGEEGGDSRNGKEILNG